MCSMKRKAENTTEMHGHNNAKYWIDRLDLKPHPEGGHYKEVFRSEKMIDVKQGNRSVSTSIYYLLEKGERSTFHSLLSDETWYFHDGDPVEIVVIDADGKLTTHTVGMLQDKDVHLQLTIPAHCWFAARSLGGYSLVGCHVAPGFDFADFTIASEEEMTALFHQHTQIIKQFYF